MVYQKKLSTKVAHKTRTGIFFSMGHSPDERRISRQGRINIIPINVKKHGFWYTFDLFSTLVDLNWGWTLFSFCVGYFGTWIFFALVWHLILYVHGDLDSDNILGQNNGTWRPCITGIHDFRTSFLFSVETQHTTGYGFYQVTEECINAILLLCIQSITGVILEGILVGLVFMKMSGAKKRAAAIKFSRNAVITKEDGKSFFMFRVGDIEKTHLLEVRVRAYFVKNRPSEINSSQIMHCGQEELEVHGKGEASNKLLLFWPTIILHEIDEQSPFSTISQSDLGTDNRDFEVIVVIDGTVEATGIKTQARSSYLPHEILMGCSFKDLMEFSGKSNAGERLVDYSEFHETTLTPLETFWHGHINSYDH